MSAPTLTRQRTMARIGLAPAALSAAGDVVVSVPHLIAMEWPRGQVVTERHRLGLLSLMAPLLDGTGPDRTSHGRSP